MTTATTAVYHAYYCTQHDDGFLLRFEGGALDEGDNTRDLADTVDACRVGGGCPLRGMGRFTIDEVAGDVYDDSSFAPELDLERAGGGFTVRMFAFGVYGVDDTGAVYGLPAEFCPALDAYLQERADNHTMAACPY